MEKVVPRDGLSRKQLIANDLRRRIQTQEDGLAPGVLLPPEQELAEKYGVSRPTVREALVTLREEGLIETRTGRGSVVIRRPAIRRFGDARYLPMSQPGVDHTPFSLDQGVDRATASKLVDRDYRWAVPATPQLAEKLQVAVGTPVLERNYLFWDKDRRIPQQMGKSYVPMSIAQGAPSFAPENEAWPGGTVGSALAVGIRITLVVEEIQARLPYPDEREVLKVAATVPVFEVHRVMYAEDGTPVEAGLPFIIPADRAVMVNQVHIPWSESE